MPTSIATLNGRTVTLDARPDRADLRDLPYRPAVDCLPPSFPADEEIARILPGYIGADLILDQGREGACTGYGLACVVNYLLWRRADMRRAERVSARMLYHLARFYDEWPGEDYEGSSCRGALKGWHKHGVCLEALWPSSDAFRQPEDGWDADAVKRPLGVYYRIDRESVVDMQAAIAQTGAIYVSAYVHKGWSEVPESAGVRDHAGLPEIEFTDGKRIGGHAFALVGYNERGFVVQNSWGRDWGADGFAVLSYEDWVCNGTDAWVIGLGVPVARIVRGQQRGQELRSPRRYVFQSEKATVAGVPGWLAGDDPLKNKGDALTEDEAYLHALITGNDGLLLNRLPFVEDAAAAARHVCYEVPKRWLAGSRQRRVVIYAHGGLNDEQDSIRRIRVMAPYFRENGVYPIFVTWKSGWQETLAAMLSDQAVKELGVAAPACGLGDLLNEAWDRTIEVLARNVLARSMWSEMKENVQFGQDDGRGIDALAMHLRRLREEVDGLEIHLVGHSAGSFVLGRLLQELGGASSLPPVPVASCTLYAPACDIDFALRHYKPAMADKLPALGGSPLLARDAFRLHVLSEARELDDTVGPYCKSLLYLVSRALERRHKTPLLGLATAFEGGKRNTEHWHKDTLAGLQDWQEFFWNGDVPQSVTPTMLPRAESQLSLCDAHVRVDDEKTTVKATHGSFDNDIDVVGATIERIIGGRLEKPVDDLSY
ncbi:MAG TPA: alpha/beta hydrolase [Paucimonas sp.]|nr:alpha/beta hydrolase [Paucimonas sp.]